MLSLFASKGTNRKRLDARTRRRTTERGFGFSISVDSSGGYPVLPATTTTPMRIIFQDTSARYRIITAMLMAIGDANPSIRPGIKC